MSDEGTTSPVQREDPSRDPAVVGDTLHHHDRRRRDLVRDPFVYWSPTFENLSNESSPVFSVRFLCASGSKGWRGLFKVLSQDVYVDYVRGL